MKNTLDLVIDDAAHGDAIPLLGMLDYLINECLYSHERIILFADRILKIPKETSLLTLNALFGVPKIIVH